MSRETLLTRTFVQLADILLDEFDIVELLTLLAERCVEILDVSAAGVMLATAEGGLRVVASSSEPMRLLEVFELQASEGPCVDCYRTRQPVLNEHLGNPDDHWPRFGRVALDAGFHSVHALPMRLRGDAIGALNLFRCDRCDLHEADIVAGQALADAATITVLQHRAVLERRPLGVDLARWHRPRDTTLGLSPKEEQTLRGHSARTFSKHEQGVPAIETSAPVASGERVIELEHRLRRIAAELEAAGVKDSFYRFPTPNTLPGLEDVTSRQREVATRLARGERVSTIARDMYLSPSTVRNHLTSLYRKVGVHSQGEFLDLLRRQDSNRP
jgi:DNA-binding CsgD family transcriptional regulator